MTDAIYEMKPKLGTQNLAFHPPRAGDSPNLFLAMAQKGAGPGVKILPPLVVYNNDGNYTDEIKEIYFGKQPEDKND